MTAPVVIGSALGLVGPVSAHRDRVRWQVKYNWYLTVAACELVETDVSLNYTLYVAWAWSSQQPTIQPTLPTSTLYLARSGHA